MNSALAALDRRFPNKRAFVTGGAGSLGLAIARLLAESGWSIGVFDLDTAHLAMAEATLGGLGPLVQAYPGDVRRLDELTVAVNSFAATAGGLDLMVNCAGIARIGPFAEIEIETWRELLDTNVLGLVTGARAAIPHLRHNGRGMLLNIACASAFTSLPNASAYSASKAAALSLTETLMAELSATNIQVSVALPGLFKSKLLLSHAASERDREHAALLLDHCTYTPDEVARDILVAASQGRTHVVVPGRVRRLMLYKRFFPVHFARYFFRAEARRLLKSKGK
jgi:NAD(P)-dependent dehydrogenase (short-subunit alcohol dehydrogenase family)